MLSLKYVSRALVLGFLLSALPACTQDAKYSNSDTNAPILQELSEIRGTYIWHKDLKRYIYSDKQYIEEILAPKETEYVVKTLVDCLDNLTPTNSLLKKKKVALGIICYEALSQTAYYEHVDTKGDISRKWAGDILPTATPNEMNHAKEAWKKVIKSKAYILY